MWLTALEYLQIDPCHLSSCHTLSDENRLSLKSACLTSPDLRQIAQPLLFASLNLNYTLEDGSARKYRSRTLERLKFYRSSTIAPHVRAVRIAGEMMREFAAKVYAEITQAVIRALSEFTGVLRLDFIRITLTEDNLDFLARMPLLSLNLVDCIRERTESSDAVGATIDTETSLSEAVSFLRSLTNLRELTLDIQEFSRLTQTLRAHPNCLANLSALTIRDHRANGMFRERSIALPDLAQFQTFLTSLSLLGHEVGWESIAQSSQPMPKITSLRKLACSPRGVWCFMEHENVVDLDLRPSSANEPSIPYDWWIETMNTAASHRPLFSKLQSLSLYIEQVALTALGPHPSLNTMCPKLSFLTLACSWPIIQVRCLLM